MDDDPELTKFAQLYAEAWCSQDPEKVASFYAKSGSISVNGGSHVPIAEEARGFMRTFPDMVVTMDDVTQDSELGGRSSCDAVFHWTLTGTNTRPGGTGDRVRISGYELWQLNNDGLIEESKGHFDGADYDRQLSG